MKKYKTTTMALINEQLEGRLPPRLIIIDVKNKNPWELFTTRRMQLLGLLKGVKDMTVQDIANATGRKKEAVSRDLHLLEQYGVIIMNRNGKRVYASANADAIMIPIGTMRGVPA